MYGGNIKGNLSIIHNAWETNVSPSFRLSYITDNNGDLVVQRRELYNSFTISHILSDRWKLIGFSEFDMIKKSMLSYDDRARFALPF